MSENIVSMRGITKADDIPENILEKAKSWGMKHCVIIGMDENDELLFGGSSNDEKLILWYIMNALWFIERNNFERQI